MERVKRDEKWKALQAKEEKSADEGAKSETPNRSPQQHDIPFLFFPPPPPARFFAI